MEIVQNGDNHSVELNDVVDVTISNDGEKRNMRLKLVSFLSGESTEYKEVTLNSPIGQAVYEKKKGDEFSYSVGKRQLSGVINAINKENNISQVKTKVL